MRQKPEIVILVVLLLASFAGVLWYVIDRRSKMRAIPAPVATKSVQPETGPVPVPPTSSSDVPVPIPSPEPVRLGGENELKTIDFSSGKAVIKDSAEDKAAIDAALKDMAAATQDVSFGPSPKKKP